MNTRYRWHGRNRIGGRRYRRGFHRGPFRRRFWGKMTGSGNVKNEKRGWIGRHRIIFSQI